VVKKALIFIVTTYKTIVSPFVPKACRFYPSCSEYAKGALVKYGAIKGTWLAICRILRCSGYNRGGFDPVN